MIVENTQIHIMFEKTSNVNQSIESNLKSLVRFQFLKNIKNQTLPNR